MKKTERSQKKASSAARAAELLAQTGSQQKAPAFGFGGHVSWLQNADARPVQQPVQMHARWLCSHDSAVLHEAPAESTRQTGAWPCRFSGAQQIIHQPASFRGVKAPGPAAESAAYGDIDGEAVQHLRRLSKRDPTTKVKALQVGWRTAAQWHCTCMGGTAGARRAPDLNPVSRQAAGPLGEACTCSTSVFAPQ